MRRILLFLSLLLLLPTIATAATQTITINASSMEAAKKFGDTNGNVEVLAEKSTGSTAPSKYKTTQLRLYGNNTLTITSVKGQVISKVSFKCTTETYMAGVSADGFTSTTSSTTTTYTAATPQSSVVFTASKEVRIQTITITLEDATGPVITKFGAPAIALDYDAKQFTVTPATNTTESYKLWYCVTDTEALPDAPAWQEYTAPVAFADDYNRHHVHAYAQSLDAEKYSDSDVATVSYKLNDPSIKEVTATVKFVNISGNTVTIAQSWSDYVAANSFKNTWVSDDNSFTFETVASVSGGTNYPKILTNDPSGLRIYSTSGNSITVSAPEGYKFASVSYTSSNSTHYVAIDGTTKQNNDPYIFTEPASSFKLTPVNSNNNKNTAVQTITFVLVADGPAEPVVYVAPFDDKEYTMTYGETITIPLGDKHPNITYTYEPEGVISIDADGKVTALKAEAVYVTANWSGEGWVEGNAAFMVTVNKKKFTSPFEATYEVTNGSTLQLSVGENAPAITYLVDANNIIEISETGLITAKAVGSTLVVAGWGDAIWETGEAEFTVTVKALPETLVKPTIEVTADGYTITNPNNGVGVIMFVEKVEGETPAETDYQEYTTPQQLNTVAGNYVIYAYVKANSEGYSDSEVESKAYSVSAPVVPSLGGTDYVLVKNVNELKNGDKIIIATGTDSCKAISTTQNKKNRSGANVVIENDIIKNPSNDVAILELGVTADGYTFKVINGDTTGYLNASGVRTQNSDNSYTYNNWLQTVQEPNEYSYAKIEITDEASIIFNNSNADPCNILRYNKLAGNNLFSCYFRDKVKDIASELAPVYIYKQTAPVTVQVYQLVKDANKENAYVTYKKNTAKQYDVTLDAEGNVTSFVERPAEDVFDYNAANAKWTAKVACVTAVPADYVASEAATKTIDKFAVAYGDQEVMDFTAKANENAEAVYVAVKEFGTLTGFMDNWTAKFEATLTENNAIEPTKVNEVSEPAQLALTMPVYSVKDVTFDVRNNVRADVAVNDALTGEEHTHTVSDALVNELDVKININTPNVESDALLAALNALCVKDVLKIGDAMYAVTYDNTAEKSVTIVNEDPNKWLDDMWQPLYQNISLQSAFTNSDLLVYNEEVKIVDAHLSATPLEVNLPVMTAFRAKVVVEEPADGNNVFKERLYLMKTNVDLQGAARSTIENVTLNNGGNAEYVLIKADGKTALSNYVAVADSKEQDVSSLYSGKCYHKFSELEKNETMVQIAESEASFHWYANMDDDNYITKKPKIGFAVANFFTGNTTMEPKGLTIAQPAAAPAAEAATHYVLYPPMKEGEVDFEILTAVEEVEVANEWIKVGAGSFEVVANGVMVYDLNGVMIADGQGRYNVPAGIYLAVYGKKAVKVVVK